MSITLILGGARSGKTHFAQEIAARLGNRVLYIATAEALDEEMSSRIEAHKRSRPSTWKTVEARTDLVKSIVGDIDDAEVVVLDCLTLLVSNLLDGDGIDAGALELRVTQELEGLFTLIENASSHFIIISNELGLGLVPVYPSSRAYRDVLGLANQMIARRADEVYLMVAGIPITLKKEESSR